MKQKLLTMGGMAEQAVERAVEAYRRRDGRAVPPVLEGEPAINTMEREIDELALDLLAMQQPMAVDLRFITAVMKINADLERVGDQAVNIAERVKHSLELPESELAGRYPPHGRSWPGHGAARTAGVHRGPSGIGRGSAENG